MRDVEWLNSGEPVPYPAALAVMEQRVALIRAGRAPELIWLLEHPPLYTAGTSAAPDEIAGQPRFPVFRTGRGGRVTYHGPGQRVAYVMLDLRHRGADVRAFVRDLEQWLMATLAAFGVKGERRDGRIGVWVASNQGDAKIAAIGVRVRHWISYHGVSLNVAPDLSHYRDIVPCGVRDAGVTSLAALGVSADLAAVDEALEKNFTAIFARPTVPAADQPELRTFSPVA